MNNKKAEIQNTKEAFLTKKQRSIVITIEITQPFFSTFFLFYLFYFFIFAANMHVFLYCFLKNHFSYLIKP